MNAEARLIFIFPIEILANVQNFKRFKNYLNLKHFKTHFKHWCLLKELLTGVTIKRDVVTSSEKLRKDNAVLWGLDDEQQLGTERGKITPFDYWLWQIL